MKREEGSSNRKHDRTARCNHHIQNILLKTVGKPIEFGTRLSHQGCKTLPREGSYKVLIIWVSYGSSGLMHVHHRTLLVTHLRMSEPFSNPAADCQGVQLKRTLASLRSMRVSETPIYPITVASNNCNSFTVHNRGYGLSTTDATRDSSH